MFNIEQKSLKTDKICLLDADYLKYIYVSRISHELENENAEIFAKVSFKERIFEDIISELLLKIEDPIIFCFSGKSFNTFRYYCAIEKEYKGNRKSLEDPYPDASSDRYLFVSMIQKKYNTLIFEDLEADDIVSVLQDDDTYIMSKDKDLNQVPGYHYDWGNNSIYEITKGEAMRNLCYQLIKGDTTDNIPGIKGMGDVKTAKILNDKRDSEILFFVFNYYLKEFGQFEGLDRFTENVNLVKMRMNRKENDFFKKKYIRMFDIKENISLLKNKNINLK